MSEWRYRDEQGEMKSLSFNPWWGLPRPDADETAAAFFARAVGQHLFNRHRLPYKIASKFWMEVHHLPSGQAWRVALEHTVRIETVSHWPYGVHRMEVKTDAKEAL